MFLKHSAKTGGTPHENIICGCIIDVLKERGGQGEKILRGVRKKRGELRRKGGGGREVYCKRETEKNMSEEDAS